MNRFADPRVYDIHMTRACPDLPSVLAEPAYRLIRLLLASRTWGDVSVFTKVALLPDGRFIAPVHGKWGLAFEWMDGLGAYTLAFVRV